MAACCVVQILGHLTEEVDKELVDAEGEPEVGAPKGASNSAGMSSISIEESSFFDWIQP